MNILKGQIILVRRLKIRPGWYLLQSHREFFYGNLDFPDKRLLQLKIFVFSKPFNCLADTFFQRALSEMQIFPGLGAVPPGVVAAHPGPGGAGDRWFPGDPGQYLIANT